MPALLFTKENPFALCKRLQKNKSKAPAKAGQTAPNDIIVPAGPTPFQPGPIIGELAVIGIKSGVEDGKVAVKENSVVAKAGDVIKAEVASILTRLGIEPMEIGLDLVATYEKGEIFTKDVLSIDEQEYIDNLTKAATWSINLAIESAFPTKETTEMLIVKAFNDAKALAIEQNIISDLIAGDMIEKAEREMLSLKTDAKIETTEKPTEEKKEEAKPTDDKVAEMVEKTKEVTKDEPKAEEKKEESTDDKIAEMVKKTKDKMTGKEPKADDLLKEADKS
jgi:large subunit ribosomal protein L10